MTSDAGRFDPFTEPSENDPLAPRSGRPLRRRRTAAIRPLLSRSGRPGCGLRTPKRVFPVRVRRKERTKSGYSPMIHATKQSDLPRIPLGNRQIGVVLRG